MANSAESAENEPLAASAEDRCDCRMIHADKVQEARDIMMSDARVERLAMTYRLLGDPTRLRIIQALARVEMCVCDIAASLGISESAVSHQLRRLREMSVVQKRRQGQILYYSLCDDRWAMLVSAGEALLDAPRPQPIEARQ